MKISIKLHVFKDRSNVATGGGGGGCNGWLKGREGGAWALCASSTSGHLIHKIQDLLQISMPPNCAKLL